MGDKNNLARAMQYVPPGIREFVEVQARRAAGMNPGLAAEVIERLALDLRDQGDEESSWYEFNQQAGVWNFDKTENHVFAPYAYGGRRIGDMDRNELIEVIALGYHERDQLAKALVVLAHCELWLHEGVDASEMDLDEAVNLAEMILTRRPNGIAMVIEEEGEEYQEHVDG